MRTMAVLVGLIALLLASAGTAKPPSHFTVTLEETHQSDSLTATCGFDVIFHWEGTATATLFFDKSGTLIREIDTAPNLKITFSAPSTGKSFTFPVAATFNQDYSGGTTVGSPVLATLTGLIAGAGSRAPDAGRLVFDAVIGAISPEGIPRVDVVSVISASGYFNEDLEAARCAALSA